MIVESALFDAERPTLMLPPKTSHLERGAAVAWNGSLEAATALERAVDMLEANAPVTVVQIGELRSSGVPAAEAVAYLESHGFSATSQTYPDLPGRTTEILLQAVKEIGAGVLIAGAYSHSRMREAILGGVTANLMTKAHVPVFFAR
jgi:nucleotide-binding universal stress UspA family protein